MMFFQSHFLQLKNSFLSSAKARAVTFIICSSLIAISCTARSQNIPPAAEPTAEAKTLLSAKPAAEPAKPAVPALHALDDYKKVILSRWQRLEDQGVLIESLDGNQTFADLNADTAFNPASVMKLATSLVALEKFSPSHRYRTNFYADGTVDKTTHTLVGDLVVEGGLNPMFSRLDGEQVAAALIKLGVAKVTGKLRIAGGFYFFARGYKSNLSRETSQVKLYETFRRAGLKIDGGMAFGERAGTILMAHYSDILANLLLYQNAHSSNAIAEVIGESLGGAEAIQSFLTEKLGLQATEVYVGHPSGLEFNRLTPRASLKILRALIDLLNQHSLKPDSILAVAGVDKGTLGGRFAKDDLRGAILAKTGTLFTFDRGVSTLVGIAYTKARGTLLFAIFNSDGRVHAYRNLQDNLLEETITELGGASTLARKEETLDENVSGAIVQTLYKE
jgi:D-alanyl-D-alanine carboxypeptidase/D-alanyl-D-alanine-endopeptidase (penicillin-binding protein 4)